MADTYPSNATLIAINGEENAGVPSDSYAAEDTPLAARTPLSVQPARVWLRRREVRRVGTSTDEFYAWFLYVHPSVATFDPGQQVTVDPDGVDEAQSFEIREVLPSVGMTRRPAVRLELEPA